MHNSKILMSLEACLGLSTFFMGFAMAQTPVNLSENFDKCAPVALKATNFAGYSEKVSGLSKYQISGKPAQVYKEASVSFDFDGEVSFNVYIERLDDRATAGKILTSSSDASAEYSVGSKDFVSVASRVVDRMVNAYLACAGGQSKKYDGATAYDKPVQVTASNAPALKPAAG